MISQTAVQPEAPAMSGTTVLSARGVGKTFRMGDSLVHVLKSVDMNVRRGEFLAIEGRSGSGKSTLLHILGALDEPDKGSVEFDGQDLAKMGSNARSRLRNTQFGF